eukprot:2199756-Lingulodinium_polyedra.AAC.1
MCIRDSEWLPRVFGEFMRHRRNAAVLFPFSLAKYGSVVSKACDQLGIKQLKMAPHCFRHSGPSQDSYVGTRTLGQIQKRGGWRSRASVLRYEKHGKLLRQLSLLSLAQQRT